MTKNFAAALALLSLAGCAAFGGGKPKEIGGAPGLAVVGGTEMPAPNFADMTIPGRPYLIGPFDKLTIDVFGIPELGNREVQTDAAGNLSFPLAGAIAASGKSPAEVEQLIEQGLRQNHVRDPQVTVNLKEAISQVVSVDGQVNAPGLYPVIGRMSLLRAIASAKGTSEFAKLNDVVVFRTVNGQKMAALYNLKAIRDGAYEDPAIYANDVIVVGDSPSRRMFKDLLQTIPLITTPLVVLLRN